MKIIDFDKINSRIGTYCTQWDFIEDRFGKKDLLPFSVSDMDIKTSPEIIEVLEKRIQHGIFGYTRWNHADYKNAIINWYKKRVSLSVKDSWISYSPGVVYSIIKLLAIINPSKKPVTLVSPCYDNFPTILKANSYPMITIAQSIKNGKYQINWEEFDKCISQSAVFLLCNPNNPDGKLWSKEELEKIIDICKKYQVFIISDDIHMDFVYKPLTFVPIIEVAKVQDYVHKVAIVSSSSKTFNLSGLGGSYILCPNKDIKEEFLVTLQKKDNLSTAMALHVSALIVGYNFSEYWVDQLCDYLKSNLNYAKDFFEKNLPELEMTIPQGTYFAWINCSKLGIPSEEIQKRLINKGNVAIMDGDRYLSPFPSLRMLVSCPRAKLIEGLERIKISLKN